MWLEGLLDFVQSVQHSRDEWEFDPVAKCFLVKGLEFHFLLFQLFGFTEDLLDVRKVIIISEMFQELFDLFLIRHPQSPLLRLHIHSFVSTNLFPLQLSFGTLLFIVDFSQEVVEILFFSRLIFLYLL